MLLSDEEIKEILNLETGKLAWSDLERFFARGIVVYVDKNQDLVEIGTALAKDQATKISELLGAKKIKKPENEQVILWHKKRQVFWVVVVAPWVVIQETDA